MNKKIIVFIAVLSIAGLVTSTTLAACGSSCSNLKKADADTGCGMKKGAARAPETTYSKCGQLKNTAHCCKTNSVKCPKGKMKKDSTGGGILTPEK